MIILAKTLISKPRISRITQINFKYKKIRGNSCNPWLNNLLSQDQQLHLPKIWLEGPLKCGTPRPITGLAYQDGTPEGMDRQAKRTNLDISPLQYKFTTPATNFLPVRYLLFINILWYAKGKRNQVFTAKPGFLITGVEALAGCVT